MENKVNKRYDDTFKKEAVDHLVASGKSFHQVSKDLGIADQTLRNWHEKYSVIGGGLRPSELQAENARLKKELSNVRVERDILKKSIAIFAKQQ